MSAVSKRQRNHKTFIQTISDQWSKSNRFFKWRKNKKKLHSCTKLQRAGRTEKQRGKGIKEVEGRRHQEQMYTEIWSRSTCVHVVSVPSCSYIISQDREPVPASACYALAVPCWKWCTWNRVWFTLAVVIFWKPRWDMRMSRCGEITLVVGGGD